MGFGDLHAELLANERIKAFHETEINLTGRHEPAQRSDGDFEATFVGFRDDAIDDHARLDFVPIAGDALLATWQSDVN